MRLIINKVAGQGQGQMKSVMKERGARQWAGLARGSRAQQSRERWASNGYRAQQSRGVGIKWVRGVKGSARFGKAWEKREKTLSERDRTNGREIERSREMERTRGLGDGRMGVAVR